MRRRWTNAHSDMNRAMQGKMKKQINDLMVIVMEEKCICEFEGLYKGKDCKLLIRVETDFGGFLFRSIRPNYCPVCGKELPEEE